MKECPVAARMIGSATAGGEVYSILRSHGYRGLSDYCKIIYYSQRLLLFFNMHKIKCVVSHEQYCIF